MHITVRKAVDADKQEACVVEGKSTPRLRYLERMWNDFINDPTGPLFLADVEGKIAGLGKITQLYDGSGWLETLRVDPTYQRQGVGKAIYQAYLEHAKIQNMHTLRMYTGLKNLASAGLARYSGFSLAGQYSGADLDVVSKEMPLAVAPFKRVKSEQACGLLQALADGWENFMVFNRTFYKMNQALYKGLAQDGMVYYDDNGQNVLTLGARFMPERGLHIGIIKGDVKTCLDFALVKAKEAGVSTLSIMFPPARMDIKEALISYGFTMQKSDCIIMEFNA